MGKLNWFKKRHKQTEATPNKPTQQQEMAVVKEVKQVSEQIGTKIEQKKVDLKNPVARQTYLSQNCDQIIEATKQMEEFQLEYEAVTSYLSDMQVIDQIPEEPRREISNVAREILTLTRERNQYLNGKMRITKKQYELIETHEDEVPSEVKKIREKEEYLSKLRGDLATLEGEKANLAFEYGEVAEKQKFLNLVSILVAALTAAVLAMLLWIRGAYYYEEKLPFILTVVLALACTAYIANESRKNRMVAALIQRKQARAIGLQNTVKLKFVNNKLSLDYSYAKYNINSSKQLAQHWEEYVKQKELNNRYKNNTELLNYHSEKLIRLLRGFYIRDAEVWIHQTIALLEPKEMVEIRHRLNVRRQKLRERMEYNMQVKGNSIENVREVLKKNPEAKEEVIETLKKYQINL